MHGWLLLVLLTTPGQPVTTAQFGPFADLTACSRALAELNTTKAPNYTMVCVAQNIRDYPRIRSHHS